MSRCDWLSLRPAAHAAGQVARLCLLLALASGGWAQAEQASAGLVVRVDYVPPPLGQVPQRVFCSTRPGPGRFGTTATTVCATGAVVDAGTTTSQGLSLMQGGTSRPFAELGMDPLALAWFSTPRLGNLLTGWQLLRRADGDYLELTLGW